MVVEIVCKQVCVDKVDIYKADHIEFCHYNVYLTIKVNGLEQCSYREDVIKEIKFLSHEHEDKGENKWK